MIRKLMSRIRDRLCRQGKMFYKDGHLHTANIHFEGVSIIHEDGYFKIPITQPNEYRIAIEVRDLSSNSHYQNCSFTRYYNEDNKQ